MIFVLFQKIQYIHIVPAFPNRAINLRSGQINNIFSDVYGGRVALEYFTEFQLY